MSTATERRITRVESELEHVKQAVDNIQATTSLLHGKIDQLLVSQPRVHSLKEIVTTSLATASLMALLYAGATYWFRAEFHTAAQPFTMQLHRDAQFVESLQRDGRYYRLEDRVAMLERAIQWHARIMRSEP